MSDEPVPDDVRELILRHIDLVTQLEALLFFRARPGESWESDRSRSGSMPPRRDGEVFGEPLQQWFSKA